MSISLYVRNVYIHVYEKVLDVGSSSRSRPDVVFNELYMNIYMYLCTHACMYVGVYTHMDTMSTPLVAALLQQVVYI